MVLSPLATDFATIKEPYSNTEHQRLEMDDESSEELVAFSTSIG
jgi:hypothetical protein